MRTHPKVQAIVIVTCAAMLLAPSVLADTCCANVAVGLEPRSADPADTVRVTGLRCLAADNSGPLPFSPGGFWLAEGHRAAETHPDTVPGPGLPGDLPPTEEWPAFTDVIARDGGVGDATITVPSIPDGWYQLWWWCSDGTGPGGGIHYSTGPRLRVGNPPDTATVTASSLPEAPAGALPGALVAIGVAAFGGALVSFGRRRTAWRPGARGFDGR